MSPDKLFCTAKRKDGGDCHGTGLCPAHRPGFHEIAALGGRNKAKVVQLEKRLPGRLRPVLDLLAVSIEQVHTGTISPAQGSAIASLASAMCRVNEVAELEIRLTTLEIRLRKG
jgi:hypothetical protein